MFGSTIGSIFADFLLCGETQSSTIPSRVGINLSGFSHPEIMSEMFREAGDEDASDEADQGPGARPSVDALLTAFRAASQRRKARSGRAGMEEPSPSSSPPEEETPESNSELVPEPIPSPGLSPATLIEETVAAFRKAERGAGETRTEEPPAGESPPEKSSLEEEVPEEEAAVDEDLAPAFRRALSEQPGSGPAAPEGGLDPVSSPASDRPETTFLWVTGPTGEQSGIDQSDIDQPDLDQSDLDRPGELSVPVDRLSEPRAREADAFLLRGGGEGPYRLLCRIRGHPEAEIYLKPVFWRHAEGEQSLVSVHVDGKWEEGDRSSFGALREKAAAIHGRIGRLQEAGEGGDGGVELRVLRFMTTRSQKFAPQRTVENSDGFVYPKLTPLLDRESRSGGGELSRILSMLEERRLLTGEFVMRQHACRNCDCAFLNFEEMCPHCGAADLEADDLVHHFRCAFTGALSEYKKEKGKLVCPKCDRYLKQIGVDYDKPSIVYTCQRCHEEFQDPEVQTTCYQCGHTNPPEQQVERQVKKYEVTALGEETAIYGLSDSLLSILKRESRVLDYATFQLIVDSEAARIERYQRSTSSLMMVRVTELKQLRMELGGRSQEVIEEIATAFDNTLRSSDYLSARDESLYLFLLTETNQDGARRAGERLEENIESVLNQNLAHPPELDIAVQPIRPGIDLDELAERFLASSRDANATIER